MSGNQMIRYMWLGKNAFSTEGFWLIFFLCCNQLVQLFGSFRRDIPVEDNIVTLCQHCSAVELQPEPHPNRSL